MGRLRTCSKDKYSISCKTFNNLSELYQHIQLLDENDSQISRTIAFILSPTLTDINLFPTSKRENFQLFYMKKDSLSDSDIEQIINHVDEWLKLQLKSFEELIRQKNIDTISRTLDVSKGNNNEKSNVEVPTISNIDSCDVLKTKEELNIVWFHALIEAMEHNGEQTSKSIKWFNIEKEVIFLSTSRDRSVAFGFAAPYVDLPGIIPVLFDMKLDTNIRQKPFAKIDAFSSMDEAEVLLSMGFVFRIQNIQFDSEFRIWIVELISETETDQIKDLLQHIRHETAKSSLFGVLYRSGEYSAALHYGQWSITKFENDVEQLMDYFETISLIYKELGQHDNALACIQKSSRLIFAKGFGESLLYKMDLARFYYNLGLVYLGNNLRVILKDLCSQKDYKWINTWLGDEIKLTNVYNSLGFAYLSLKQYRAARYYLSKTLEIQLKFLPKKHYHIAITYLNIGYLQKSTMNYSKALECYIETIEILKVSRDAKHFTVFKTYQSIAEVYEIIGEYSMALENYQNAFNHATEISKMIRQMMNISRIYHKMKQHDQAITMSGRAALLCREYSLPMNILFSKKYNIMLLKPSSNERTYDEGVGVGVGRSPSSTPTLTLTF
ncbi:hypothetical protein I4U23_016546 [Adineta vaga]|nr:hypothetical protein I4U23_016546 [Adineta vaga]